ncbi:MAG: GNAT family N-acetyltransferase [Geodermatophilaceae bacterium]
MRLLEPTTAAAAIVAGWSRSAEEAVVWCSRAEHPFPADVVRGWWTEPDVEAWLLVSDEGPVGYGEIWLDEPEDEVELARLIVAPEARHRGVGKTMVAALLERVAQTGPAQVFLRVRPDNEAAIRCYSAAGLTEVDQARAAEWNAAQPEPYIWMEHPPPAEVT